MEVACSAPGSRLCLIALEWICFSPPRCFCRAMLRLHQVRRQLYVIVISSNFPLRFSIDFMRHAANPRRKQLEKRFDKSTATFSNSARAEKSICNE